MDLFNVLVGVSTIGSFIVAIIALSKVDKIEKHLTDNSNKTSQTIKNSKIKESNVRQVGRDSKGD